MNVLAPLGLLVIVGVAVLIVLTARKQRRKRAEVFRNFASEHGWDYYEQDDGTAQSLSEGFERFARFSSPSLGERPPTNVVLGSMDGERICLFLHATRKYEGNARQWTVCLIEANEDLGPDLRIRPRSVSTAYELGADPTVSSKDNSFEEQYEVLSEDIEGTRVCLDAGAREFLVSESQMLPFPVEIQIRKNRMAVYVAKRNDEAKNKAELRTLVTFAVNLSRQLRN